MHFLAELIGTFFFVSVILNVTNDVNNAAIGNLAPLAIGAALMVCIYMTNNISKGSFNPAVSIALGLRKKLTTNETMEYIVAEVLGALLAIGWFYYVNGKRLA